MIYNDRTVRGVILARLSVMKKMKMKKVNLAVSKVGFGGGVTDYGWNLLLKASAIWGLIRV